MPFSSPSTFTTIVCLVALSSWTSAHTVITYPGWRGNNLRNTSTIVEAKGLGVNNDSSEPYGVGYPYGMQWIYPCGGQPISQNRTKWPVTGGAIGIQPGWFSGHASAFFYINLGDGNIPLNYSLPMVPVFHITGPSNSLYGGSFCLGQVPLPANYTAVIGNNATIQVIETAQHGAALYNCVDITFADPKDVEEVTQQNCENTTNIGFELVYSTSSESSANSRFARSIPWLISIPLAALFAWGCAL